MARLNIWWGAGSVPDASAQFLPALVLPGFEGGDSMAETMTDIVTSTASSAAPDYGFSVTPCIAQAIDGDVWITGGETASVDGADCVRIPNGVALSFGVPVGATIKAIAG